MFKHVVVRHRCLAEIKHRCHCINRYSEISSLFQSKQQCLIIQQQCTNTNAATFKYIKDSSNTYYAKNDGKSRSTQSHTHSRHDRGSGGGGGGGDGKGSISQQFEDGNPIHTILDNIPFPFTQNFDETSLHACDNQRMDAPTVEKHVTPAFKKFLKTRNLELEDGICLYRLMQHILCGGFPDFPRFRSNSQSGYIEDETFVGLQEFTNGYWSSMDRKTFQWLQKQKKLYAKHEIHPWIEYKLVRLNVTLQWTRYPLQDRHFRWLGFGDGKNSNVNRYESADQKSELLSANAESDPLFPFQTKDQPLFKFLNPFYQLWYDSMPSVLKQLRLMNENRHPNERRRPKKKKKNSDTDTDTDTDASNVNGGERSRIDGWWQSDEIRSKFVVEEYDWEQRDWVFHIGPQAIDAEKMAADVQPQTNDMSTEDISDDTEHDNEIEAEDDYDYSLEVVIDAVDVDVNENENEPENEQITMDNGEQEQNGQNDNEIILDLAAADTPQHNETEIEMKIANGCENQTAETTADDEPTAATATCTQPNKIEFQTTYIGNRNAYDRNTLNQKDFLQWRMDVNRDSIKKEMNIELESRMRKKTKKEAINKYSNLPNNRKEKKEMVSQRIQQQQQRIADAVAGASADNADEEDDEFAAANCLRTRGIQPMYSEKQRALLYIEALKRGWISAPQLNMREMQLVLKRLRLEAHYPWPRNENSGRPAQSKSATFQQHMRPIQFNAFRRPHGTDAHSIFGLLDVYHKTRHPMQAPYGVWDIPAPNFNLEYKQSRIDGWLTQWRRSSDGQAYIHKYVKKAMDVHRVEADRALYARLQTGIELLTKEKAGFNHEITKLMHDRKYRCNSEAWVRSNILETQRIQSEIARIEGIIDNVYQSYHWPAQQQ